ncbi:MAG: hydroxypyruvate isomerase family protein [Leucobacter sp.]
MSAADPPRYAANLSILFSGLPLSERPAAAAERGFAYAESWWPFAGPAASEDELAAFCESFERAGVQLVLLNLTAGASNETGRGILTDPDAGAAFEANLASVCEILERTGCRVVNALYGNRLDPAHTEAEDALALERIVRLADRIAEYGATVVVETLNSLSSPSYPLVDIDRTAATVAAARSHCRHGNVALLLDTYHLTTMGRDPAEAIRRYGPLIGHVQFADAPGRGEPGTGAIDFTGVLSALDEIGFSGFVGLEYDPRFQAPTGVRI